MSFTFLLPDWQKELYVFSADQGKLPKTYPFERTWVVFFGPLTIGHITRNREKKKEHLIPLLVEQRTSVINEIYEVALTQASL